MDNKIDNRDETLTRRDFIKTTAGAALATRAITMADVSHSEAASNGCASVV